MLLTNESKTSKLRERRVSRQMIISELQTRFLRPFSFPFLTIEEERKAIAKTPEPELGDARRGLTSLALGLRGATCRIFREKRYLCVEKI